MKIDLLLLLLITCFKAELSQMGEVRRYNKKKLLSNTYDEDVSGLVQ